MRNEPPSSPMRRNVAWRSPPMGNPIARRRSTSRAGSTRRRPGRAPDAPPRRRPRSPWPSAPVGAAVARPGGPGHEPGRRRPKGSRALLPIRPPATSRSASPSPDRSMQPPGRPVATRHGAPRRGRPFARDRDTRDPARARRAPGPRRRTPALRLDRRARAANAADRPAAAISTSSSTGASRTAAVEREFLERGRRSSARWPGSSVTCSSCPGSSPARLARDPSVLDRRGHRDGPCRGAPDRVERGLDACAAPPPRLRAALGDRGASSRSSRISPRTPSSSVARRRNRRARRLVRWLGRRRGRPRRGRRHRAGRPARIFERFYRMAAHERITGTGLGLPIARDLARTMGGELDVASQVGGGSSFVLALPGPGVASRRNGSRSRSRRPSRPRRSGSARSPSSGTTDRRARPRPRTRPTGRRPPPSARSGRTSDPRARTAPARPATDRPRAGDPRSDDRCPHPLADRLAAGSELSTNPPSPRIGG